MAEALAVACWGFQLAVPTKFQTASVCRHCKSFVLRTTHYSDMPAQPAAVKTGYSSNIIDKESRRKQLQLGTNLVSIFLEDLDLRFWKTFFQLKTTH